MTKLLLASACAMLPIAAHAADLGPVEYSWIKENAPADHQAIVTFSLAATYFDMDAANGFAAGIFSGGSLVGNAGDGFSFDTWGITGDIETWIPTNASLYIIGGLEGAWVEGDQNSEVATANDLSILPIDGGDPGKFAPTLGGALGPFEISSSGEFYRVGGLAGIGTEVSDGTKVGVGAYVAYSELDLDAHYSAPAFPAEINTLDETVKTWSAGLAVLGESRREVMRGIGVFFKGRAAALYANGELDAGQNGVLFGTPLSADDRQEKFAGLVEGQAGFDIAIGPNATVSIFGGAAWRNDVFEIVNPLTGSGITDNQAPFPPAHLEQTDLIEYSAGGKVAFKF